MDTELLEFRIEQSFAENSQKSQLGAVPTVLRTTGALHYGKFYFSGLKKGQGITVANALRRVLLYDIFGIGITKVKFGGLGGVKALPQSSENQNNSTLHEFSTVSGMKESILELLIHLRSIIWTKPIQTGLNFSGKFHLQDIINSSLSSNRTKPDFFVFQAKHLESALSVQNFQKENGQVEPLSLAPLPRIVNPDHYLATFVQIPNTGSFPDFEFEFEVHTGSLETQNSGGALPDEFLVESGPFFPIKKVNYTVELEKNSTKNLHHTNISTECVFFEIWTDGSIDPEKALKEGFSILEKLFKSLNGEGSLLGY